MQPGEVVTAKKRASVRKRIMDTLIARAQRFVKKTDQLQSPGSSHRTKAPDEGCGFACPPGKAF